MTRSSRSIGAFFALLDWSQVPERDETKPCPGSPPHEKAYVKALLVKKGEKFDYITELRRFLVNHPLLVLELGCHPVRDSAQPNGFDVEPTVPCDRWLRHKQQVMDNGIFRAIFQSTVHDLQAEIPRLFGQGDVVEGHGREYLLAQFIQYGRVGSRRRCSSTNPFFTGCYTTFGTAVIPDVQSAA